MHHQPEHPLLGFISLEEEGSFHSGFISFGSIHMLQNSLFRGASMAQGQGKETAEKQFFW